MTRELPPGTVTLLFTDIEGSTRLLQELGRDEYVGALGDHRRLLREAFARHNGAEVEMQGDSFFFAFARASDAVHAAAEGQQALEGHEWPSEPVRVRIGIHTGEPILSDGLYVGLDVHRAARVMSAGHGGQTLLSQTTRDLVEDEFELRDLGLRRLKDLSSPVRLYQLNDGEFPPLKTLDATNLPIAASPLVGRGKELGELVELLGNGTRLLTVTGAGGTGKTRLALQAAAELTGSFADGVFWVPLAGLDDAALVLPTVGQTVGGADDVIEFLRDRQVLLVLDNLEHLALAGAHITELTAAASRLRVLGTSRAPLHVSSEYEYRLDPLPPVQAMTLFVERARQTAVRVEPDATVEAICRRLDGLPLAIELAAARTNVLAPEQLLSRLDQMLPLLASRALDIPERQRTLRATVEWSYDLLDARAQALFARLAVFSESFSFEAAEDVCAADVDTLSSLVDLSLLKSVGNSRFLMLGTIREYAAELLDEFREIDDLRNRHASYFLALAERAESKVHSGEQTEAFGLLDVEVDNFRVALSHLLAYDEQAFRTLAISLRVFWLTRGHYVEGLKWLKHAIGGDDRTLLRRKALSGAGTMAGMLGDLEWSKTLYEEALALSREHGDFASVASDLRGLANVADEQGDLEAAERLNAEAIQAARAAGDDWQVAAATMSLGLMAFNDGQTDRAETLLDEAIHVLRRRDDPGLLALGLLNRAEVDVRRGTTGEAAAFLREAILLAREVGDPRALAMTLIGIAEVALAEERASRAVQLLGAAHRMLTAVGLPESGEEFRGYTRALEAAHRQVGAGELQTALAEGGELSDDEAVAWALAMD